MADTKIQKQGEVFISQSEYDALRLAGNLQSNTKYHITKTPKTGVDSLEQMNLLNGDKTVTYTTTDGMTVNGKATLTYDGGTTKDVPMDIDVPVVAGEGITIDKVNGQEKVEVKLDTAFTDGKYVPKVTEPWKIYATDYLGNTTTIKYSPAPVPGYIPIFNPNGCLKTDNPVKVESDSEVEYGRYCVNLRYANQHYLEKVTTGNVNQAYTVDTNNQQAMMWITEDAGAWALARRYTDGRLKVGTAVEDSDAMPKKQVEDGFVAKQEGVIGQTRVYTVRKDKNGSYQETTYADSGNTEWSIALRSKGGVVRVGNPVGFNDATNKAYVDGLHHYTHIISLVGSSNTIYITIAAKGYPNPITEIDDAGSTPSLSDLLLASGQSAKAMATGLVTDLDGSKGTVVALWSDNGSVMVEYIVNGTLSSNSVLALGTYTITDIVA